MHDARTMRRLRSLPGDCPRSTSRSTTSRSVVYVASGESGALRTYRLGDAKLLGTRRIPAGSYNVCAQAGRMVTPSLDVGTLTLLDARGLRSVRIAPNAHDACLVVGAEPSAPTSGSDPETGVAHSTCEAAALRPTRRRRWPASRP